MREITNVLKTLNDFRNIKEDGTYEYQTGEAVEYSTGYQVSFVRPEAFTQLKDEEWDTLTSFCCNYLQSEPHIGVYGGEAEVSFHSLDLAKSEEIMRTFNQESIFDWQQKEKYPDDFTRCLIMNQNFDKDELVNYHEILKRIQ